MRSERAVAVVTWVVGSCLFAACVSSNGAPPSGSADAGLPLDSDSGAPIVEDAGPGRDATASPPPDAQAPTDAPTTTNDGEGDAGIDAAPGTDSGSDAGPTPDAGLDAGEDAEPPASGTLDPGFGGGGSTLAPPATFPDGGAGRFFMLGGVMVDAQGRIVFVGETDLTSYELTAWRVLASGASDTTFGTRGVFATSATTGFNANGVCEDGSGNVLVSGYEPGVSGSGVVWRLTPAGAVDTTFAGGTGYAEMPNSATANAVACTAAGTLVAGGYEQELIARFTSAGVLDTSFASSGYTSDPGEVNVYLAEPTAMTLDGAGNILLGGRVEVDGTDQSLGVGVWRYTSTGVLDSTFGGLGGTVPPGMVLPYDLDAGTADAGGFRWLGSGVQAAGIQVDSSGRILVADEYGVARLTASGGYDWTFAGGAARFAVPVPSAVTALGAGATAWVTSMVLDSQGRILLAGYGQPASGGSFMVVWRLTTDGALDATFGTGGSFAVRGTAGAPASGTGDYAYAITVDATDHPIIVGTSGLAAGGEAPVVWRLTP